VSGYSGTPAHRSMSEYEHHRHIRDLALRYALCIDKGDPDGFIALFADGAEIRIYLMDRAEPLAVVRGAAEFADLVNTIHTSYHATMHIVTNHLVSVDADDATGTAYCLAHHYYRAEDRSESEVLPVRYNDRYVRGADGWQFLSREIHRLWTEFRPAGRRPLTVDLVMAGRQATPPTSRASD